MTPLNPFKLAFAFVFFVSVQCYAETNTDPNTCTYSTYKWNVNERRAVEYKEVQKNYVDLTSEERDVATGCSVCQEDQRWVHVGNLEPVRLCKAFANRVEQELNALLVDGVLITKLVGYRVGMTRGKVDSEGNRTGFSNHSFGIALDINDEQNGLYDQCIVFDSKCRLRKGGPWDPNQEGSLTLSSEIVLRMKALGFKWGGEIAGRQKDFMHFSPTGY